MSLLDDLGYFQHACMSSGTKESRSSGNENDLENTVGVTVAPRVGFEPHTTWRYHPQIPFFLFNSGLG